MSKKEPQIFQGQSAVATDFLAGGGEMGERIRSIDWAATPLGPVTHWPQSLKTIVRIMLTSRQPIWIGWGPEMIVLYNDPYKAIAGGKHPWALGRPVAIVWREIWDEVEPRLGTALEKNEGTYDEALLLIMERYGYQEETYYTFSYSPVPGDQGGVEGIICANTDDTQRIIGERQLKLLRTLSAESVDARTIDEACRLNAKGLHDNPFDLPFAMIYLLDQDKRLLSLAGTAGIERGNRAAPEVLTLNDSTLWPFAEVVQGQKPVVINALGAMFDDLPLGIWKRAPHQAVAVPIAPSGQTGKAGILLVGLNPFRLFDEDYQGFIDLVARQIAASIANAQAYEEERKRAEALAEIDRAKTVFFSNVSHELRTPLTLMLGPIEDILADNTSLSEEQRERIEILHRNSLRLLKLVNTLLDFSRIEAGRVQATYEPTDLAALTADLASTFRSAIEKAGMKLLVDCPPLAEPVYIDREMWEKIVLNLLSNAFKYTFEGVITVALHGNTAFVELRVSDTGVGIPQEELPHMFERFHRVKGIEGRSYEGTGIGLSLVSELVKLHGGTVTVESVISEGSTFTVSIPAGSAHLPQDRVVSGRTPSQGARNANLYIDEALRLLPEHDDVAAIISDVALPIQGGQQFQHANGQQTEVSRVLLADDNADVREYVGRLLESRYAVLTVPDGRAALAAVKEYKPDLVLSDVMMPGMDGFELLQALRSKPETRTLPVIMLSARAGEEARIEGMEAGVNDYLVKPFSARELIARVGMHLEMARIRKEAEENINAERQRLHDLFMQAPALIAVLRGPDHVFELANPLYMESVGKTRDIIGRPIRKALPELEGQGIFELLDTVYTSGTAYVGEEVRVELARKDEGELDNAYFQFVYQPSRDAKGHVDGILLHATEVTDQVYSRRKIEKSQKDFAFLAEASKILSSSLDYQVILKNIAKLCVPQLADFCVFDVWSADFSIQRVAWEYVNAQRQEYVQAVEKFTPPSDHAGNPVPRSILSGEPSFIPCFDESWMQKAATSPEHLEFMRALGYTSVITAPLIVRGKVVGNLAFIYTRDSHRQYTREDLAMAREIANRAAIAIENSQLYSVAQKEIEERKKLERQKDDFIGIASHELKTPVTSIKAYTQLLERRFRNAGDMRSSELLKKMDAQINRLTGLIGDLFDITKIESGKLAFHTTAFEFDDLENEIIEEIQRTTPKRIVVAERVTSVTLSGDRDRIGQVLTNLLTNAIKYSPSADEVIVRTSLNDGAVITSVQDFGIGIPDEKLAQVFERFFRVEGEMQTTYPGLGLGLFISAEIVRRHNGQIWVESEEGKGSTFFFSIPLEQPAL